MPAVVDVHNPDLTGGVQNQPDFQAGSVDHRTHFVSEVPHMAREIMAEYSKLTGRTYAPIVTYMCDDAETVVIGALKSVSTEKLSPSEPSGVASATPIAPTNSVLMRPTQNARP